MECIGILFAAIKKHKSCHLIDFLPIGKSMQPSMEINFRPDEREINKAGKISSEFLKSHGFSDNAVHTQIKILRELISNGIRYGNLAKSENKITVQIHIAENTITVEVSNPVDETCYEQLKELDKTLQFIRGYQDPYEAYLLKQKENSQNSSHQEINGLGLARIACEGSAILDFFVSKDNILNLFAVKSLNGNLA